jgi:hypothetical protein
MKRRFISAIGVIGSMLAPLARKQRLSRQDKHRPAVSCSNYLGPPMKKEKATSLSAGRRRLQTIIVLGLLVIVGLSTVEASAQAGPTGHGQRLSVPQAITHLSPVGVTITSDSGPVLTPQGCRYISFQKTAGGYWYAARLYWCWDGRYVTTTANTTAHDEVFPWQWKGEPYHHTDPSGGWDVMFFDEGHFHYYGTAIERYPYIMVCVYGDGHYDYCP